MGTSLIGQDDTTTVSGHTLKVCNIDTRGLEMAELAVLAIFTIAVITLSFFVVVIALVAMRHGYSVIAEKALSAITHLADKLKGPDKT